MKCPWCGKQLTAKRVKTNHKWSNAKTIVSVEYRCGCGYKKGWLE